MLPLCVVACPSNAARRGCSIGRVAWDRPHRVGGAYSFSPSFVVENNWYCPHMSEPASRRNPIIEQVDPRLTMDRLPPPNIGRWIARRKAEVVAGVRTGLLSLDEACVRYGITIEEFLSWQRLLDEHGMQGLRVTRLQDYRRSSEGGDTTHAQSVVTGSVR